MNAQTTSDDRRRYRQTARAAAAEATVERVREAFAARLNAGWFDEIRLEDVARDAGVTVQTVIRRFGGKEGLLEAVIERMADEIPSRRRSTRGDIAGIVHALIEDYEVTGDLTLRMLAQEDRYPILRRFTDRGRRMHRDLVEANFAPWLDGQPAETARRRLDGLVVALDVYVWKLIRRDMRRPILELQALMERLAAAVLSTADPETRP
jgi:AcrR family transcriptional regulator